MTAIFDFLYGDATASEAIMNTILSLAGLLVLTSLWSLHKRNGVYKNFNLTHLLINKDGFPDGAKCMEIGAFLLLSWGFIAQVTNGKLSDAYTAAYVGAFAVRGAYGAYLRNKGDVPPPEGTTTVIKTSAETTEVSKGAPLKEPLG